MQSDSNSEAPAKAGGSLQEHPKLALEETKGETHFYVHISDAHESNYN